MSREYAQAEELDVPDGSEVFDLRDAVLVEVELAERGEAFEVLDLLDLVRGELDHLGARLGREVLDLREAGGPS